MILQQDGKARDGPFAIRPSASQPGASLLKTLE
jgi:hypothetical protein